MRRSAGWGLRGRRILLCSAFSVLLVHSDPPACFTRGLSFHSLTRERASLCWPGVCVWCAGEPKWRLFSWLFQSMSWTGLCPPATRRSRPTGYEYMPTEPGKSSDQMGYEQLCTRWNREEAEARLHHGLESPTRRSSGVSAPFRAMRPATRWALQACDQACAGMRIRS